MRGFIVSNTFLRCFISPELCYRNVKHGLSSHIHQQLSVPRQRISSLVKVFLLLCDFTVDSVGCLSEVLFSADYVPPASSDLHEVKRTPEEMEKEAKRQEEELQKLVLVEIK